MVWLCLSCPQLYRMYRKSTKKPKHKRQGKRLKEREKMVGERGFEPPTPGPELGGAELVLLVFNHLSGASTVSVLLDHASLGVM